MLQAADISDRTRQLAHSGRAAFIDINQYIVPKDLKLSLSPCMRWNMARRDAVALAERISWAVVGSDSPVWAMEHALATISRPVARAL
ncbi:hypothetical protein K9B33_21240 [Sphingobium sp. 3R8]|uniref:hypothetical protein n=1 Tax=Sphingobium sp. 3R8 TaxID=2874921 RepID=UPI001CCDBAE0|nr:hypothetical protein [Sphingobium sp. 3R8]MBZ9650062.1 hypothetical protein [Sphingobium sp. 3R8]